MNRKGVRNDHVIEKILQDPNIEIRGDEIYSRYTKNGRLGTDFRLVGSKREDGYSRFVYKGKFVLVHRVLYRKPCCSQ